MAWIVRLVKAGADGAKQCADVLMANVQQEIVAAQAKGRAVRRPDCRSCGDVQVKDYRNHAVATLFGQITVRLPRFRCGGCGGNEAGHG